MIDPVIAADGCSYERSAITEWFSRYNRSPKTNEVIPTTLVPNHTLRNVIEESHEVGISKDQINLLKSFLHKRVLILHAALRAHFKAPESVNKFCATLSRTAYSNIYLGEGKLEKAIVQNIRILDSVVNNEYTEDFYAYTQEKNLLKSLSRRQQRKISQLVNQELKEVCSFSLAPDLKSQATNSIIK